MINKLIWVFTLNSCSLSTLILVFTWLEAGTGGKGLGSIDTLQVTIATQSLQADVYSQLLLGELLTLGLMYLPTACYPDSRYAPLKHLAVQANAF